MIEEFFGIFYHTWFDRCGREILISRGELDVESIQRKTEGGREGYKKYLAMKVAMLAQSDRRENTAASVA